jgi:hypothetical protein
VLLRDAVGPVMADALAVTGPLNVLSFAAQAVAMGDDVHVRTQASTNLLLRTLLPALVAGTHPRRVEVAEFLSANYLLFLSLAMAAAFAAWLAGPGVEWQYWKSPLVGSALYQPGRGDGDAAPDIGDSSVLELVGLGCACAAGSPAVAQMVGGTLADAIRLTEQMDLICVGRSTRFTLPTWGMRGSPVGVDVRKVVELGITPRVTTGILHNSDGSGQIGAGVAVAPIEVFVKALMDLDARIPQ